MAPWEHLGGGFTTGPAAASWGPGRLDVFGRGFDNALWQARFADGQWSGWSSLGGGLTSRPAAASWGPGRIDVVVKGTDNAFWHRGFGTPWPPWGLWSSWRSLDGQMASGPALASPGSRRLELFANSPRLGGLVQRSYDGGWGAWSEVEPDPVGAQWDPAAACPGQDRIDLVFVHADGDTLVHQFRQHGAWQTRLHSAFFPTSSPGLCSSGPGRLDVVVRGTDHAAWHSWFQDDGAGWRPWESLGGILTAAPAAVSWGDGRIDVIAKGTDDAYWHRWFDGGTWHPG